MSGSRGREPGFSGRNVCGNIILATLLYRTSLLIASQSESRRLNVVTGVVLFIAAGFILIM